MSVHSALYWEKYCNTVEPFANTEGWIAIIFDFNKSNIAKRMLGTIVYLIMYKDGKFE